MLNLKAEKNNCLSFQFSPETGERGIFFLFQIGLFSEKRGSFITILYFNPVLKCPIYLKTKFGTGVLD
jgi:hypothetical protein